MRAVLATLLVAWTLPATAQPALPPLDPEELQVVRVLQRIETALATSDRAAWLSLISTNADPDAAGEFFDAAVPRGVTRAVVRERDRVPLDGALPGDGYRMIVEVFVESGPRGQLSTWRLDIRRPTGSVAVAGETDTPWRVVAHDRLSQVDALHRLALDRERHYAASDFVLTSVDFELRLPVGNVFVANTAEGVSALVLLGDGQMTFHPTPKTEQGQVRLFAGADALDDPLRRGLRAAEPVRLRAVPRQRHADRHAARGAALRAGARDLRRRSGQVVQPRPERHEPRHLVDPAAARRHGGRGAHPALPHAHLRAGAERGRGRHVLQPRPQAQHRDLRLAAEAGQPRRLLRRGRPHRVRRARLRPRHRRRARPRVAHRPGGDAAAGQVVRARRAHAHPRRHLHHLVDHQQGAGPAALPARPQPERRGRQPALAAVARLRADAHHHLPGPSRAAVRRLGVGRPGARATAPGGSAVGVRRAQLAAQQPRALVPAAGRHRLRPGHHADHGAARVRGGGVRGAGVDGADGPGGGAGRAGRALALHLRHLAPGALPGRGRQPHDARGRGHGGPRHRGAAATAAAAVGDAGAAHGAAQAAAGRRPQHREPRGDGQPAAGEPGPRRPGHDRRHPPLLRLGHGRRAVPGVHGRDARERPAGRPQPGVLRGA